MSIAVVLASCAGVLIAIALFALIVVMAWDFPLDPVEEDRRGTE
jgi:formate hydrogenlyase subunit 4